MGRLVFFGNERLATGVTTSAPTLEALIAEGHEVVAVVSNYERGTSRNAHELEIQAVADKHNIPVLLPEKPTDILQQLINFKAEAAVLVAYGKIVPQSIIDAFPKGIINIHPSLLPLHRGPIPLESVILEGSKKTGVSVMQLVRAMDAGPVYGQTEVALNGSETKQELADSLLEIGGKMVVELLPGILDGSIVGRPQDDANATYDKMIAKKDGIIDRTKTAEQLAREIRAYAEWPKSLLQEKGKDIIITKASVIPIKVTSQEVGKLLYNAGGDFLILNTPRDGLKIEKLKPAGKREMTAKEFLIGNHEN